MKPGRTGAKRQSFHEANTRAVIDRLIEDNPKRSQDWLFGEWWKIIRKNEAYLEAIAERCFTLDYNAATKKPGIVYSIPRPPMAPIVRRAPQEAKREIGEIKESIRHNFSLLQMDTPLGKPLSQCTGTELIKIGGWYASVGRRVGRRKVSSVMTEDMLSDLLEAA